MKIAYSDPMQELKLLLDQAVSIPNAFVVLTKSEMAAVVRHTESQKLFPAYFTRQATRKQQLEMKMVESKKRVNNPSISQEALQDEWDIQTRLERQIRSLEEEVPTELRSESGVTVKVSMTA